MNRKRRETPRVTDAELSILELLWEQPDLTIRQIADPLYPGRPCFGLRHGSEALGTPRTEGVREPKP